MTQSPQPRALDPVRETKPGDVPTLLLVDDEKEIRDAYRAILDGGFHVLEAENGLQALGVVSEQIPDLIISDISMPDMDGVEMLRQVRARDLDIPVILITGEPQLDGAMRAVEHGALRYLTKPIDPVELNTLVQDAIGFRRMADAKREAFELTSGTRGTASDQAGQTVRFERALATIRLHFQPIYSATRQQPVGYECLLRCDERSLSSPPDLIGVAEELGRTEEVGRRIRACALAALDECPESARLFVNLHYADLNDPELFDPAGEFAQNAHRFVLEITERESLVAIANASEKVAQLRALGFHIAMDDLGAGHNGLAAFARLAPEIVKLDMQLVRGVDRERRQHELVRVMRDYCERQGMQFIAEGVETASEMRTLVDIGVDLFQGYFIARPGPHLVLPPPPDLDAE